MQPFALVAGAAVWLLASQTALLIDSQNVRVLLGSGIITAYTWLAAYEFWRDRDDLLISRWPTILVLGAYGAQVLLHTPLSAILPWTTDDHLISSAWLHDDQLRRAAIHNRGRVSFLAIAKERNEFGKRQLLRVYGVGRHIFQAPSELTWQSRVYDSTV